MKQGTLTAFFGVKPLAGRKEAAANDALTSAKKGAKKVEEKKAPLEEKREAKPAPAKVPEKTQKPKTATRKRKKKEEEDDEEDFVVGDEEEEEEEEEYEEDEVVAMDEDEDELELFDDEQVASENKKPGALKKKTRVQQENSITQFVAAAAPRPLPVDQEFLSSLVSKEAMAAFANVTPRQSTEPIFASDPKTHKRFAKAMVLQQRAEAEVEGEDGPSFESSLASIKRRQGVKYTPLEVQFLDVKQQHPDVVLFVECGYKFKFFGPDAIIASRVLGIMCLVDKNFYIGSVPVQRLNIHMERLVVAGYKVGVVRQTETAALKQGSQSKGKIFTRDLGEVYSSATFFGDAVVTESSDPAYMVCILEEEGSNELTVVAISLCTSDFQYDTFKDNFVRASLETRLMHLAPVEILTGPGVSAATDSCIKLYKQHREKEVRVSPLQQRLTEAQARAYLAEAYSENSKLLDLLQESSYPGSVVVGMALLGQYLKLYDLERALLLVDGLRRWTRDEMVLSAETLANLQVLDGGPGSLIHLVDKTVNPMGHRLMRQWLGHPLMSADEIEMRQEAVQATRDVLLGCGVLNFQKQTSADEPQNSYVKLIRLLSRSGDLEQATAAIFHRRCSPDRFIQTLKALRALLQAMQSFADSNDAPNKQARLIASLLRAHSQDKRLNSYIETCLAVLSEDAVQDKTINWTQLFRGRLDEPVPDDRAVLVEGVLVNTLAAAEAGVKEQERLLQNMLPGLRKLLGLDKLEYKSVSGREYLLEVPRSNKKACDAVPDDWEPDQHTKASFRYMAPSVKQVLLRLNMFREATVLLAKAKWNMSLAEFSDLYSVFRGLLNCLATLDCINSFALLAASPGYVRPTIARDGRRVLEIDNGRHPSAEGLSTAGTFIGNDTKLGEGGIEHMIITGPNMGGKSTYIRGVAQIVILAQCGSFVPADRCETGLFDSVFVRMGAEDNLFAGRSTFFSELLSASAILETATERSLVIIDELGRGTSTFDGTAIAYATLRYLAESVRCLSFFVTHYPMIGSLSVTHSNIGNCHLAYVVEEDEKDQSLGPRITFLYSVRPGLETRSYGLNVARLALSGFDNVLSVAAQKAHQMEERELQRQMREFQDTFANLKQAVEKRDVSLIAQMKQ